MKVIIFGSGGHARVVYETIRYDKNKQVVAFVHHIVLKEQKSIDGIPVMGDHSVVPHLIKSGVEGFIVGVGDNKIRKHNFEKFKEMNLIPINTIHPTANIAHNVKFGNGIMVGMSATINTDAEIGDNSIINTSAIIEHDDIIEENVHIAPGTSIAGGVIVKKGVFIGIGCTLKNNIVIGENSIIGAGSVVLDDIPDNVTAVGSPARVISVNIEQSELEL